LREILFGQLRVQQPKLLASSMAWSAIYDQWVAGRIEIRSLVSSARPRHSVKAAQRIVFPFLSLMSGIFEEGGRNLNERPDKSESPGRQPRRCRNQLEIG
jgi:hypothetical protein